MFCKIKKFLVVVWVKKLIFNMHQISKQAKYPKNLYQHEWEL